MTAFAPIIAFLDASVLYPAALRSILLYLALEDLYQPLWSDAVHEEWMAALLRNRPDLHRSKLERTRGLMDKHFPEATVIGFEERIEHLQLPDANDRHVLAAAIQGGANIIVTTNLADFPAGTLAVHGLKAMHPDLLIHYFIEFFPDQALAALRADRLSLKSPCKTVAEYLSDLESLPLIESVASLRHNSERL